MMDGQLTTVFCWLLLIFGSSRGTPNRQHPSSGLIEHVKRAINPTFHRWVLFSNGTYIIVEDSTVRDEAAFAQRIMRAFGPVQAGSPAGDFGVLHLTRTDGWAVSGYYSGMYTYVSPKELEKAGVQHPTDIDIGLFGRHKRDLDAKEHKIIYINM